MILKTIVLGAAVSCLSCADSPGHAWSAEMEKLLNSDAPDWVRVGESIRGLPVEGDVAEDVGFRPLAGDSRSTRDRVYIPGRGLEIRVDYPISWYFGSSLSPDGTKLLINSGTDTHLIEIMPDGTFKEGVIRLPLVTYDKGPKGFISGWSWADDRTLIGRAEIDDKRGEFIEHRIYIFHTDTGILRRLDLSALDVSAELSPVVTKVATDLRHLMITIGEKQYTINTDLNPQATGNGNDRESGDLVSPADGNSSGQGYRGNSDSAVVVPKPAAGVWLWGAVFVIIVIVAMLAIKLGNRNR